MKYHSLALSFALALPFTLLDLLLVPALAFALRSVALAFRSGAFALGTLPFHAVTLEVALGTFPFHSAVVLVLRVAFVEFHFVWQHFVLLHNVGVVGILLVLTASLILPLPLHWHALSTSLHRTISFFVMAGRTHFLDHILCMWLVFLVRDVVCIRIVDRRRVVDLACLLMVVIASGRSLIVVARSPAVVVARGSTVVVVCTRRRIIVVVIVVLQIPLLLVDVPCFLQPVGDDSSLLFGV